MFSSDLNSDLRLANWSESVSSTTPIPAFPISPTFLPISGATANPKVLAMFSTSWTGTPVSLDTTSEPLCIFLPI